MTIKNFPVVFVSLLVLSLILYGCSRQGEKTSSAAAEQMGKDLAAAFNSHDIDKLLSFYTDDFVYEDVPFGKIIHGKEEYRAFTKEFVAGAPDIKMELKSIIVSGDRFCMESIVSGTHTGNWPNLPATGKSFSSRGVSVGELRDGKIKQDTDYYDGSSLIGIQTQTAAANPFVGTWKLNVAKSKVTDLSAMPKSETMTYVAIDNGVKIIIDGIDTEGKYHFEDQNIYDGKDYPLKGNPDADTSAIKKVDANTVMVVLKKAGKEMESWRCTVSKDGKTETLTGIGMTPKRQPFSGTFIYDKQ